MPVSTIRSHGPPPASSHNRACCRLLMTGRTPVARAKRASSARTGPCRTETDVGRAWRSTAGTSLQWATKKSSAPAASSAGTTLSTPSP